MRLLFFIKVLVISCVVSITPGAAQENAKDLATKASAELRLLRSFQTLERMTNQLNHILLYAIHAERGGWGVLEFVETTDYATNAYVIKRTAEDLWVEIIRAHRSIEKSKVVTVDELGNAQSAVESLTALFALAPRIATLVAASQLDAAALLYHKIGQPAFEDALRNAQSAVGTSQKRLAKRLLEIRIAK